MRVRNLRIASALGLATAMVASLAVVGSAALGKSKPSAAQYQYKVAVCHRTKSKKKPFHLINVSVKALPAHLNHGDVMPPCPTAAPAPSASTTASSSTSTKGHGKGKGNQNGKGNANGKGKNK